MPSTPLARQNSFEDVLGNEGAERILNASLRVEAYFDALGPEPAVAHAFFAQEVGAAGLADRMIQGSGGQPYLSTENLV